MALCLCRRLFRIKTLVNHNHYRFSTIAQPSHSAIHTEKIKSALSHLKSNTNNHNNPAEQILYFCLSNTFSDLEPPSGNNKPIHDFLYELHTQPPLMYTFLEQLKGKREFQKEHMFNHIISVYGQAGMFSHARGTFDEMHARGITPSVESLNALLAASLYCDNIGNLRNIFVEYPRAYGITRNIDSYKLLISGFAKYGNSENARRILEHMIENTFAEPDQYIYFELMEYLCKDKNYLLYDSDYQHYYEPEDGYNYDSDDGYYYASDCENYKTAVSLTKACMSNTWFPDTGIRGFTIMKTLVYRLKRNSMYKEVVDILEAMQKNRLQPDFEMFFKRFDQSPVGSDYSSSSSSDLEGE